jgi:uncharacterized membrane protein
MKSIIVLTLLLISIAYAIIVNYKIRTGKIKRDNTYSYRTVIKMGIRSSFIAVVVSLLIYLVSDSFEVTISLGILFMVCIAGGCLYGLLLEYQVKRRGGKRLD